MLKLKLIFVLPDTKCLNRFTNTWTECDTINHCINYSPSSWCQNINFIFTHNYTCEVFFFTKTTFLQHFPYKHMNSLYYTSSWYQYGYFIKIYKHVYNIVMIYEIVTTWKHYSVSASTNITFLFLHQFLQEKCLTTVYDHA